MKVRRSTRTAHTWTRAGLAFLSLSALVPGGWALLDPRSFHDDFPGWGRSWVAPLGAFNEHATVDVGAFFLALGVLLGIAAYLMDRTVTRIALTVWLVFAVPHLVWHVVNLDAYSTSDKVANVVVLIAVVALPVTLLAGGRRRGLMR
jgi:hypothetical protein